MTTNHEIMPDADGAVRLDIHAVKAVLIRHLIHDGGPVLAFEDAQGNVRWLRLAGLGL